MRTLIILAVLALLGSAPPRTAQSSPPVATAAVPDERPVLLVPHIVARYPHDRGAFTEGLIWSDGALYESVGMEGMSEVRRVRLADGKVLARARIPAAQFGEGLARWRDQLISLTWHDGIAHRWNARTLRGVGEAHYPGEGWGLTSDGDTLIESDGSATLKRIDARSFGVVGSMAVTVNGKPLDQLNELEMVNGALLANIWRTPYLVRIDPATGHVTAIVDLRAILAEVKPTNIDAVANGIAWDADRHRLFITGKLWPTVFEVTLDPS
ncbi:glutaminyl-peptide cyclotransferase [Sphingomonas bacterium]|uniref:glutaminyl-peptide cyclotransferase n=1 Tax=Sphingomonas bacterium TaxID=1895847 RepID=UPI00157624EB|nr:glutaminyl-peptide cyclotransferase [Sphingomonas bacterium]